MIAGATVMVECDKCFDNTEDIGLTPLSSGNWDERNVRRKLISLGWTFDGDEQTHCPDCSDEPA